MCVASAHVLLTHRTRVQKAQDPRRLCSTHLLSSTALSSAPYSQQWKPWPGIPPASGLPRPMLAAGKKLQQHHL